MEETKSKVSPAVHNALGASLDQARIGVARDLGSFGRLDDGQEHAKAINPIKLKAMAMRFRHNSLGCRFKRPCNDTEKRARIGEGGEPLLDKEPTVSKLETASGHIVHDGHHNLIGLQAIFFHPFCITLICVPLGILSGLRGWGAALTFWLNFLALIPLAKILGDATEELAACLGSDTISGLLNATFGNAVEMIVSVQSIRHGLFSVVKASLLGSVLSNILLVLGSSFLLGGLSKSSSRRSKYHSFHGNDYKKRLIGLEKEQKFPVKTAMISMAMLLFACMGMVLPSLFNSTHAGNQAQVLQVSRVGAWVLISSYIMYLIFQLLTHHVTLAQEEKMEGDDDQGRAPVAPSPSQQENAIEEDDEGASLSLPVALGLMTVTALVVAVISEFLVDTIQDVAAQSGIPLGFISVILLPIAGNACEHASALRFCLKDRPGLAIGIAVGSSTQISLLVVPFSVLAAQFLGQPLNMDFGLLNAGVMTFSVLVVTVLLLDGRSNWFKGYILLAMYVFIAALYWCVPPQFGVN